MATIVAPERVVDERLMIIVNPNLDESQYDRLLVLKAVVTGAPNSQERYYIWLPDNDGVSECTGAVFEIERPRLVRLEVKFDSSGRREWFLKLDRNIPVL